MHYRITIIGHGRIGSALGELLETGGHHVSFWDTDPSRRTKGATIGELIGRCDIIFLCIPSWSLAKVCREIALFVSKQAAIFSLTKGLDKVTGLTAPEIISRIVRTNEIGVVGGPMMAEEIVTGAGFIELGTHSDRVAEIALQLFIKTQILVERTMDPIGTALAGVLKNIYACGYGIVTTLGWSANQLGWYVSHATAEMAQIIDTLGGDGMAAYGTAGLGDFLATALSPHSSNTRAGRKIASGGVCGPEEGITSLPILRKRLGRRWSRYPLLIAIEAAVASAGKKKVSRKRG